jgi:cysteine sulfinate desulfinase/cysteine desulfurase-like protein
MGITIDFTKAVEITQSRLREERKPLLEAQDVLFQRALESGTDTKAIVAEKQRLRDITKISVTTLDELKGLSA